MSELVPKAKMGLKKRGSYTQFQYTSKDALAIIDNFEIDYGIKPKKSYLAVYEKDGIMTRYIRKAGYSAIANHRKISTKIEVMDMKKTKAFMYARVKCTSVRPDGVQHEGIGYSDSSEPGRDKMNKVLAMAQTRARGNAIAMAIDDGSCPFDDFNLSDDIKKKATDPFVAEVMQNCPKCKAVAWSRMQKKCLECGITHEEIMEGK